MTCRPDFDTDPRQRALQRWLEDLARERKKASTIVEALLAHHTGASGVTLVTLNDKLDRLLALHQTANQPYTQPTTSHHPTVQRAATDGLSDLDHLGL